MSYIIHSIDAELFKKWLNNIVGSYHLHSRFDHAINWVDDNNQMITLLSEDLPNAPNTIIMKMESFDDLLLTDNVTLEVTQNGLLLAEDILSWNDETELWNMILPNLSEDERIDLSKKIIDYLTTNSGELTDIEQMIYQKLDNIYHEILKCCRLKDYDALMPHIKESIGLGLGLTPSGDDRLVGFLLGCYIKQPCDKLLLNTLQRIIKESRDRTNEISYAMLYAAKDGHFNEWLIQLVSSLKINDEILFQQSLQQVLSIGSRSGGDMLKGLQLSLEL